MGAEISSSPLRREHSVLALTAAGSDSLSVETAFEGVESRDVGRAVAAGHLPEVDGLRALAILGVLLFHLSFPGFSLGWAGVKLFFVISGFLITRILMDSRDRPDYFRAFYIRRTLRIFPIYYLVIGICCLVEWVRGDFGNLRMMPWYLTYLQTVPQVQSGFDVAPLLGHTWSLAIEEQFYLLWPLAVFLLRGRWMVMAIGTAIVGALAVRFGVLENANCSLMFAWLPVQLDALAAGALIAVGARHLARREFNRYAVAAFAIGAGGVVLIVASAGEAAYWKAVVWAGFWHSPLLLSAMACMFAGAVALSAAQHPWTKWLANRRLVRIGKISYGIYLYHPFVFDLVWRIRDHYHLRAVAAPLKQLAEAVVILLQVGLTYLLAELSWRWVESPINRLKERWTGTATR